MKGSTQPMKRLLVLLPLLLVGCTNDKISDNSHTNSKVYQNVNYAFDFKTYKYLVVVEKETYYVPTKNYYEITIDIDSYYEHGKVDNEYFVSSNELFVYYVK